MLTKPLATNRRAGSMPAFIRERMDRRRHVMDDQAFRSCVKEGLDASAALAALVTTGGRLILPDAGENIILASRVSVPASGLDIVGGYTTILCNGTNVGLDFTGSDSGIEFVKFLGSQSVLPTAGDTLTFSNKGQRCFARDVRMEKVFNGVAVTNNSETLIENIHVRDIHGVYGIQSSGVDAANGVYGVRIFDPVMDCPYPQATSGTAYKGNRVASTAYALGDIFNSGGCIYQVTTAGTTAAGTGPNGSHGTTGSRLIADGTATVQFICSASLAWINVDSFGYTTSVIGGALLDGVYGVRMVDTLNTGSSFPFWLDLVRVEIDHPLLAGATIEAGKDFTATAQTWIGSCLGGNGVQVLAGYKGGGKIADSLVRGHAQHGVLLNQANGFAVLNSDIGSNSMAANNTYNNVSVAANVNGFQIIGNRFMPDPPGTTQQSARPVVIAAGTSDGYVIRNNLVKGHAGANTITDGGSGAAKDVATPTHLVP